MNGGVRGVFANGETVDVEEGETVEIKAPKVLGCLSGIIACSDN